MPASRAYERDHPWITFSFNAEERLNPLTWAHLGEGFSKCQHLLGTPLQPAVAAHLSGIYMRRGALASAAIEGNTLSEDEVEDIFVNNKTLPESQQYLEHEIRNVLNALSYVRDDVAHRSSEFRLSSAWILAMHAQLLDGLEVADHVTPGEYRTVSVGVGTYRGAPAEDLSYLMDRLCAWVNESLDAADSQSNDDRRFLYVFLAATLAHLYLAWIHPFGDGNGRAARLIECAILAHSGLVPWISTNLLSDFYNRTRTRYYEKLDAASKALDVGGFIEYSALGFRDQLREQVSAVQREQRKVAWINYVHEAFQWEPSTETASRRRAVVLAMPDSVPLTRKQIRHLSAEIAEMYAQTSERLFKRDMGKLIELGLVEEVARGVYEACVWTMDAFLLRPELGAFVPVVRQRDLGADQRVQLETADRRTGNEPDSFERRRRTDFRHTSTE